MLQETAMHAARDFDPATVRPRGGHYINGQFITDVGHGTRGDIEVRRPSDNQPYGQIPDAGPEGVDQTVRTAQNALKESGWSTRAPRERARVMRRWAAC
jgi:aldehyde dehydrogenase (NAD+)